MSHRAAIALLAVFAVLCGAYWMMLRHEESSRQATAAAGRVFDPMRRAVAGRAPGAGARGLHVELEGRIQVDAPQAAALPES